MTGRRRPATGRRMATAALLAVVAATTPAPARAHAGALDGSRPFVTGIEPAVSGLAASAVFAGSWEVNLSAVTGEEVAVLDDAGRPFLRFGRNGVEGDYGAAAWYPAAVAPTGPGIVRLPDGIGPATPPDWRPVARGPAWAWFDPRLRVAPGAVTPEMIRRAVPVRLGDFAIPLTVGGRPARITGSIEFEPPRGRYAHRLRSPAQPVPGVEIGLLEGQAVPTVTIRNDSKTPVVVVGADGEPFLRLADTVEANTASPTWVQVGRGLGRLPETVADATAPPRWETISGGHLVSWADVRSRPPDAEPALPPSAHRAVEVRRWTIPLRIGDRPVDIAGVTDFVPGTAAARSHRGGAGLRAAALIGAAAIVMVAAITWFRRRGSRSLR